MIHVNNEHGIWQTTHVLYATKPSLELIQLPLTGQRFLFREFGKGTILGLRLKFPQLSDRLANRLVVGQHPAEPSVVDVGLATTLGLRLNHLPCVSLGSHEQNFVLLSRQRTDIVARLGHSRDGQLKIDNVNVVSGTENELSHLRIPIPGLMTKVNTCFKQVAHGYACHK